MNRVALITGASRGIGRGIALELARRGWNLVVNFARNAAAAEETVQACSAAASAFEGTIRVLPCQGDVAREPDRARLVGFTEDSLGPIDLLVNNAGVAPAVRADLLEATEESFDQLMATNMKGPFLLTQRVARRMIAAPLATPAEDGRIPGRKIVFISSVSAYAASVNRGDYCVSKAGLAMLTRLFAARLAADGIGVFEIRPGIIATDMTHGVQEKYDALIRNGLTPIRRWGTAADVGRAVAAIAEDLLPFSTGEVINVDGGFHLRTL
ncbi:MAG: 3-ketoacyl-ACP reductase [Limisphaerales bacterium]